MKSQHGQAAFDRVDRFVEDGKMKCRKGKECNGRCIPKSYECGDPNDRRAEKSGARLRNAGRGLPGALARTAGVLVVTGGVANYANRYMARAGRYAASETAHQAKYVESVEGPDSPNAQLLRESRNTQRQNVKKFIADVRKKRANPWTSNGMNHALAEGARTVRRAVYRQVTKKTPRMSDGTKSAHPEDYR